MKANFAEPDPVAIIIGDKQPGVLDISVTIVIVKAMESYLDVAFY